MRHIALFSGIGGDTLAAEWAGFETVLFVENDKFCQNVLNKHWPRVPIIGDIKDATKERIQEAVANAKSRQPGEQEAWDRREDTSGGSEEEIMARHTKGDRSHQVGEISERENTITRGVCNSERRPSRGHNQSPIILITGGFPCQPVSAAGKRKGKEDDRWLWPDMLRVISEVGPAWVVAENVAGLIGMGLNDCISDLEGEGFEVQTFLIPACAVNAPHRRDRIFIVAYSGSNRWRGWGDGNEGRGIGTLQAERPHPGDKQGNVADTEESKRQEPGDSRPGRARLTDSSENVAYPSRDRLQRAIQAGDSINQAGAIIKGGENTGAISPSGWEQWAVEPDVGRVAHGIPSRVDRLKGLGNAIVPQQIYPILKAIAEIEL